MTAASLGVSLALVVLILAALLDLRRREHEGEPEPRRCAVCGEREASEPWGGLHAYGPTDHEFTPRRPIARHEGVVPNLKKT